LWAQGTLPYGPKEKAPGARGLVRLEVEAPGIEPSARRVANGRKRTQTGGNGRGSGDLNGTMRPFATAIRPDAAAPVYQVYQALRLLWTQRDLAIPCGDVTRAAA
jgi:hypothetical protein